MEEAELRSRAVAKPVVVSDDVQYDLIGDDAPMRQVSRDSYADDHELMAQTSDDLDKLAHEFQAKQAELRRSQKASSRKILIEHAKTDKTEEGKHKSKKKGAFAGVFVPTCENMWGVLIFLRFYFIVGHAGVGQALCAVFLSFSCAFCTTSSMSAIASSGGLVSEGGPYHMISRALGPVVGASVGIMYWLAITMLSVLETLGAVEGILMANPDLEFAG